MSRAIVKVHTASRVRAATRVPISASTTARDVDHWPRSWMGLEQDLLPGEQLLVCFRPFIEHLAASTLSPKTIRTHVDNLWMLGGEIIRDLNFDPSLRKLTADRVLRDVLQADGGPLLHNGSEEAQRSFDSTCRKLHRFLSHTQP